MGLILRRDSHGDNAGSDATPPTLSVATSGWLSALGVQSKATGARGSQLSLPPPWVPTARLGSTAGHIRPRSRPERARGDVGQLIPALGVVRRMLPSPPTRGSLHGGDPCCEGGVQPGRGPATAARGLSVAAEW